MNQRHVGAHLHRSVVLTILKFGLATHVHNSLSESGLSKKHQRFTSRVPKSLIFLLMSSHFGKISCFLVKSSSFIQFLSLVTSPGFAASMRFFGWFYLIFGWFRSLEKQKRKSTIFSGEITTCPNETTFFFR